MLSSRLLLLKDWVLSLAGSKALRKIADKLFPTIHALTTRKEQVRTLLLSPIVIVLHVDFFILIVVETLILYLICSLETFWITHYEYVRFAVARERDNVNRSIYRSGSFVLCWYWL